MNQNLFLTMAASLFFVLLFSSHLFAQQDMIDKRKTLMRENYEDWKAIKRAVEQKDYPTVELKAKDIMGHMDKVLDYFPKGSITEKSRAKAEIWEKWDEFTKGSIKVKDVANSLAKAAAAKDEAQVEAQSKALIGPVGSPYRGGVCYDACHKTFYNQPPPVKKSE